jgi:type I restriction enzyme R subunit
MTQFDEVQRKIVDALIDMYRIAGVDEIASAEVFRTKLFADDFGGLRGLVKIFGGPAALADLLRDLQYHLYGTPEAP